jgi:uncharacterized damage-inducible protein DinB
MIERGYAVAMSHYNRWFNDKLYATCAELGDAELKEDRGAFFGSVHGTLNHILWADLLNLCRVRRQPLPDLGGTDAIVHDDFVALRDHRRATDEDLLHWAEHELVESELRQPFDIWVISRQEYLQRELWVWVVQMFNHQTHHRGQVTTLLSQLGRDVGVTDVPVTPILSTVPVCL